MFSIGADDKEYNKKCKKHPLFGDMSLNGGVFDPLSTAVLIYALKYPWKRHENGLKTTTFLRNVRKSRRKGS